MKIELCKNISVQKVGLYSIFMYALFSFVSTAMGNIATATGILCLCYNAKKSLQGKCVDEHQRRCIKYLAFFCWSCFCVLLFLPCRLQV